LAAPAGTVVHEDAARQTVLAEAVGQLGSHGFGLLVAAGSHSNAIARVIVEDGQRMTAAISNREVALEIHLPQIIGSVMLEATGRFLTIAAVT
jgi:hypothetical protein